MNAAAAGLRVHVFAPDRSEDWGHGTVVLVDDLVAEETGEVLSTNFPTIRLDSGRTVTGLDCWWRAAAEQDRIVSCHRGFERTVPAPADVGEVLVLCSPPPDGGEPLFPECRDCEECEDSGHGITIMPDDAGVFHRVKLCLLKFRDTGAN